MMDVARRKEFLRLAFELLDGIPCDVKIQLSFDDDGMNLRLEQQHPKVRHTVIAVRRLYPTVPSLGAREGWLAMNRKSLLEDLSG